MAQVSPPIRPDYIGPDWLRCTDGMTFAATVPDELRAVQHLSSPNPWERLVCVTLQAQAGDFRHVDTLLELAHHEADDHLRDCAIDIFALCAPTEGVARLAELFEHPDEDTRREAYGAAARTGCLALAPALARQRSRVKGFERERVMDCISDLLEPDREYLELVDSPLDDQAYQTRVESWVEQLGQKYGPVAIVGGEPLDANAVVAAIASLCAEDDPEYHGGSIAHLFALLEGLTGWPYAGCLDDDCTPVLPRISHTLNSLRQSGRLDPLKPGQRYFFGHPLP